LTLLSAYVGHLAKLPCRDAKVQAAARRHVFDIAAMLLAGNDHRDEQIEASLQAVRLTAACAMIEARSCEPGLNVGGVAARLGISTRYLQRLFERRSLSFTEYLNEVRLRKAHALLATPRAVRQRVIDIALAVGFSDISHFNRSFRRRFSEIPTGVRKDAGSKPAIGDAAAMSALPLGHSTPAF
jgi:AraC-like DNA-binding protein